MRFPQDEARSDKEGFHNEVGYALRMRLSYTMKVTRCMMLHDEVPCLTYNEVSTMHVQFNVDWRWQGQSTDTTYAIES